MTESTGTTDQVDYRAVCEQLQAENEDLRRWLGKADRFMESLQDVQRVIYQGIQFLKRNPYLLVISIYAGFSLLDFALRRKDCEE